MGRHGYGTPEGRPVRGLRPLQVLVTQVVVVPAAVLVLLMVGNLYGATPSVRLRGLRWPASSPSWCGSGSPASR